MREIRYHHESGKVPSTLEDVPLLHSLGDSTMNTLLSQAVILECEQGDTLIEEGDDSKFFCVLLKGTVDIIKDGEKVNRITDSGEFIGEMALATEHPRSASVVAASHVYCLKIEPDFLEKLGEAERAGFFAKLYQFVVKLLGERLEESSKRIAQLEEQVGTFGGTPTDSGDSGNERVYRI